MKMGDVCITSALHRKRLKKCNNPRHRRTGSKMCGGSRQNTKSDGNSSPTEKPSIKGLLEGLREPQKPLKEPQRALGRLKGLQGAIKGSREPLRALGSLRGLQGVYQGFSESLRASGCHRMRTGAESSCHRRD